MKDDRTQAIAARAYELWERAGRPRGQHEAHWRQAEKEIGGVPLPRSVAEEKAAPETLDLLKAGGKTEKATETMKPR